MLAADAIDLGQLPRAQPFRRVEAPDALHQPLAAQDFVAARDTAMEIVGDVEEGAVAVGNPRIQRQQIRRQLLPVARGTAAYELFDRARGPYRPVAQQATLDMHAGGDAAFAQIERQHEIEQDVVVIAGIERDAVERARARDAAQHVEGAIAVERRDFYGNDIVDCRKTFPEVRAEDDAADRRLQ